MNMIEEVKHRIPKPRVIRYDETEYWSDDIKDKVNAIYMDYVYDDGECTYCCEMTPSFWMMNYNIDIHWKEELSEQEIDELWDIIHDNAYINDNDHYNHCKDVEPYSKDVSNYVYWDDDTMEDVIERLRSNPPYFNDWK